MRLKVFHADDYTSTREEKATYLEISTLEELLEFVKKWHKDGVVLTSPCEPITETTDTLGEKWETCENCKSFACVTDLDMQARLLQKEWVAIIYDGYLE